jgi:hypothetical protein
MIIDRDYVYIFGPEWEDELLECMEHDLLARRMMIQLGLSRDDIRHYYLTQPYFDHIYHLLLERRGDFVNDPVETILWAVYAAKDVRQRKAG